MPVSKSCLRKKSTEAKWKLGKNNLEQKTLIGNDRLSKQ